MTSVNGSCTWTITHNLGTEDISCTIYENDSVVFAETTVTSENTVTVIFSSSSNIPAETYSALILSKGGLDDSSDSSITIDSELSSISTNPVQNRVLYPSLNRFILPGTTISVKTDGTGDFTTIADVINYLHGKWSTSAIIIQLGSGTFNTDNININSAAYNIPSLKIVGSGIANTLINFTSQENDGFDIVGCDEIIMRNFKIKKPSDTLATSGCGIRVCYRANVKIDNVEIDGCGQGIAATSCNSLELSGGNVTIKNATQGIKANIGGRIWLYGNGYVFNNCTTAWVVEMGGVINGNNPSCTYTSVTNKVSQTVCSSTSQGWITGITV